MARPNTEDPLIPLPVRLPASTVARMREQAAAGGCSLSDVLRSHLTLAEAKPLGKPRPRRREPKLGAISGADPVLLRSLAGIGNNLNQIARAVNAGAVSGTPIESVQILAVLMAMERRILALHR